MMMKAAARGVVLGCGRGFAWGTIVVWAVTTFLWWVFFGN
jgi:hypothetical protein